MNKILVKIYVPKLETEYDVYIPVSKKISDASLLINEIINDLSEGSLPIKDSFHLYDRETGNILDGDSTIKQLQIKNGMELILY